MIIVDPSADGAGKFRILVKPDGNDSWPNERYLRPGVRANGWVEISARATVGTQQAMQVADDSSRVGHDNPSLYRSALDVYLAT